VRVLVEGDPSSRPIPAGGPALAVPPSHCTLIALSVGPPARTTGRPRACAGPRGWRRPSSSSCLWDTSRSPRPSRCASRGRPSQGRTRLPFRKYDRSHSQTTYINASIHVTYDKYLYCIHCVPIHLRAPATLDCRDKGLPGLAPLGSMRPRCRAATGRHRRRCGCRHGLVGTHPFGSRRKAVSNVAAGSCLSGVALMSSSSPWPWRGRLVTAAFSKLSRCAFGAGSGKKGTRLASSVQDVFRKRMAQPNSAPHRVEKRCQQRRHSDRTAAPRRESCSSSSAAAAAVGT
jgi:hypothetical protein